MLEWVFPKKYYKSIYDISLDELRNKNIRGIIFDIDNTLEPYFVKYPTKETINFLNNLKKEKFKVSLVSNNKGERVKIFNSKLDFPAVSRAAKPSLRGLKKAMKLMNTNIRTTAFVGDQLFTDMLAGNRMGIYTILVNPISTKDEWTVKLKRGIEKKVLEVYFKRENINELHR